MRFLKHPSPPFELSSSSWNLRFVCRRHSSKKNAVKSGGELRASWKISNSSPITEVGSFVELLLWNRWLSTTDEECTLLTTVDGTICCTEEEFEFVCVVRPNITFIHSSRRTYGCADDCNQAKSSLHKSCRPKTTPLSKPRRWASTLSISLIKNYSISFCCFT